jgi:hypothetical protein
MTFAPSPAVGGAGTAGRPPMVDAGYFAKRIASRPSWLEAAGVVEVCSVSACVSPGPEGWIQRWLHNGLGWYNRAADALGAIPAGAEPVYRLFAYRLHPEVFRRGARVPLRLPDDVRPDPMPASFRRLGFDSVSKSMDASVGFDCSPLSCNRMASEIEVNEHCLFPSLEAALAGADRFAVEQPEPGDYYVVEVLERA